MATRRPVEVWTIETEHASGLLVSAPLLRPEALGLGMNGETVASRLVAEVETHRLAKGRFAEVMDLFPALQAEAVVRAMRLRLPSPRRGGRGDAARPGPPTEDVQVVLVHPAGGGVQAMAPLWGVASHGADEAEALSRLERALLARLAAPGSAALDLLWPLCCGPLRVAKEHRELDIPTPSELRRAADQQGPRLLPRVADPLRVPRPAFELAGPRSATLDAMTAPGGRSVLLVGPHGVGKTALIHSLVRSPPLGDAPLWLTTPSRLLRVLTEEGSWQEGLGRVCRELAEAREWLVVSSFAELFEVGRYFGNPTSMGEYLAPLLARGEARVLTECTPEQLAAVEARYPGSTGPFQRVLVPEPTAAVPTIVARWAAAHAGRLGIEPDADAVAEALRLCRRFSPYSGYPGRVIRLLEGMAEVAGGPPRPVGPDRVIEHFCAESGTPRVLVDPAVPLRPDPLAEELGRQVYGQPEAVAALVDVIARVKADVAPRGRPVASLLLVGPTGVGKTETARALARFMFGSADRMLRFDMSEFSSPGAVLRLVGLGSEEGLLTGAVRRQPFSVLLFDEVEKADPAFLDLLLQVLGEGRLTDARGNVADFCGAVVLLTSNVGADRAARPEAGFGRAEGARPDRFLAAVRGWLRPELYNRIDTILPYEPLSVDALDRVLDRELRALALRPGLQGLSLSLSPAARSWLRERGHHPAFGARPVQRALQDHVVGPLAERICAWKGAERPVFTVDVGAAGALVVKVEAGEPRAAPDDAPYRQLRAERRALRALAAGAAGRWLRRASEGAARKRRVRARRSLGDAEGGHAPEPAELLRDRLEDLQHEVLAAELGQGAACLSPEAAHTLDVEALVRRVGTFRVELVAVSRPDLDGYTLGVWGVSRPHVQDLVRLYRGCAEAVGAVVEARELWWKGEGGWTVESREAADATWCGVELRLAGAGVGVLLRGEDGIWQFGEAAETAPRVHVGGAAGAWTDLEARRPPNLVRRSTRDLRARRFVLGDGLHDAPSKEHLGKDWEQALRQRLVRGFQDELQAALVAGKAGVR